MEPLTAGVITKIAFTKAFEKTVGKLTEATLAKNIMPFLEELAD